MWALSRFTEADVNETDVRNSIASLGQDQMVEEAWIVLPTELGKRGLWARWGSQVETGSAVQEGIVLRQQT